ncbi:Hypothetical predicted protein, partial [Pelobates cultripes]
MLPDITKAFHDYYSTLYHLSDKSPPKEVIDKFLLSRIKRMIPTADAQSLEAPITLDEFRAA